jgi:hypothetical protein
VDVELRDTAVLGATQLQAAFSEVVAGASSVQSAPNERDGAHLSKGCTRGTKGLWWCDLLLLRVPRIATIALLASRYTLAHSTPAATWTTCCEPTRRCRRNCDVRRTRGACTGAPGGRQHLETEGLRRIACERSLEAAHSPADARDARGLGLELHVT